MSGCSTSREHVKEVREAARDGDVGCFMPKTIGTLSDIENGARQIVDLCVDLREAVTAYKLCEDFKTLPEALARWHTEITTAKAGVDTERRRLAECLRDTMSEAGRSRTPASRELDDIRRRLCELEKAQRTE